MVTDEVILEEKVHHYLAALSRLDLDDCINYFADDAVIHFMTDRYAGKEAIAVWHRERFHNELSAESMVSVQASGQQVNAEMIVSSRRLRTWHINKVRGRCTFRFDEQGKIKDVRYSLVTPSFAGGQN